MAPRLQAIPDARISFQSQSSGTGRDITIMLASNDPAKLDEAARNVLQAMRGIELLRDPRIDGDLQRPEIIIRPRFDIAADLGVTTSALSQTIRISTIRAIEQNTPNISPTTRQIPHRVYHQETQ